jgi:hypothetical protein
MKDTKVFNVGIEENDDGSCYRITINRNNYYGNCYVKELPGCCGVGVLYNLSCFYELTDNKSVTVLKAIEKYFEKVYGLLVCTNNKPLPEGFNKQGWISAVAPFVNPNYGTTLHIMVKTLQPKTKEIK